MSPVSVEVLAEARAGGASAEQLAILAKGAVPSQEDYEVVVERSMACMSAAGVQVTGPDWASERGIVFAQIGTIYPPSGVLDEATIAAVDECLTVHSRWVERAWLDQPWADVAEQERVEGLRLALVACLEQGGVETDPESSLVELLYVAERRARDVGAVVEGKIVDCPAEVGSDPRSGSETGGMSEEDLKARAGGASEEQLAILAKGPVPSFEDYEAATVRTIGCMSDAGIEISDKQLREHNGITLITYGIPVSSPGRSDAETAKVVDACYAEHSEWVDVAWQTQPAAMEAEEQRFNDSRPGLLECLGRNGVEVDESMDTQELLILAGKLTMETQEVDPNNTVNCAAESGYLEVD